MLKTAKDKWLLIFYSVPSQPVSNRMKIWRKLAKIGAVQLKGAVYILPNNDEHYELFQWLITEVTSMGGDGAFVMTSHIETLKENEIVSLFNQQREKEYHAVGAKIAELEMKLNSIRKGGQSQHIANLYELVSKHKKEFDDIRKTDFFMSKSGGVLSKQIKALETELKTIADPAPRARPLSIARKRKEAYQGKTWITRQKPFVDRMASAWFIRRFIDPNAVFKFAPDHVTAGEKKNTVTFDIREGEFTHVNDLCTFEVIVKAFGIKNKIVKKMAELVHELDVKDRKYDNPEAQGIEGVLTGIRKASKTDQEALERGMAVFEMLYASKK
jgi:hypothetical protein